MPESEPTKTTDPERRSSWSLPTAGLLEIGPGVFISTMTVEDTWQRRRQVAAKMVAADQGERKSGE
jgi:hypothetical protein